MQILLLTVLIGCKKRVATPEDVLRPFLQEADQAWERRGSEGFASVRAVLDRARALQPQSPEVAWRRTRLQLAVGLASPDHEERLRQFGTARAIAWTCVLDDPEARAFEIESGVTAALEVLEPERRQCAVWAAHAWTRWISEFGGDAAALDFEPLDKVVSSLRRSGTDDWLMEWTWALGQCIRPPWMERDILAARTAFERVQNEKTRVEPLVDEALYLERSPALLERIRGSRLDTPEERTHAARLLAE